MTNQQIADFLCINFATVRTHIRNLLGKLGVSNHTAAAVYARESGLLSVFELRSATSHRRGGRGYLAALRVSSFYMKSDWARQ